MFGNGAILVHCQFFFIVSLCGNEYGLPLKFTLFFPPLIIANEYT